MRNLFTNLKNRINWTFVIGFYVLSIFALIYEGWETQNFLNLTCFMILLIFVAYYKSTIEQNLQRSVRKESDTLDKNINLGKSDL